MPQVLSDEVEQIFNQWLSIIERDRRLSNSTKITERIRKLLSDGKIYSQAEIKKLVDEYGKDHVAEN